MHGPHAHALTVPNNQHKPIKENYLIKILIQSVVSATGVLGLTQVQTLEPGMARCVG